MTDFQPDDVTWQYVSRKLIPARVITLWIWVAIPIVVVVVLGFILGVWSLATAVIVAAIIVGVWGSWLVHRQVTAHAWAEREDDLVIKRGRMWRAVTVVPYGRMQYVEVESGPLARHFGIAKVQLHTASPGTDASIAGVPTAEADRLRDRLTSRGESQLAGL